MTSCHECWIVVIDVQPYLHETVHVIAKDIVDACDKGIQAFNSKLGSKLTIRVGVAKCELTNLNVWFDAEELG